MNMIKRIILSGLILVNGITRVLAQSYPLTIEEMFRLADQNSKSIRAHQLAIYEAKEGIEVAKNDRLPSLQLHRRWGHDRPGFLERRPCRYAPFWQLVCRQGDPSHLRGWPRYS